MMSKAPTILVVEDEPVISEVVTIWLEEAGFTVLTASDGDEALILLSTCPTIDALLTDIRMPGKVDGWSLAERARAANPRLPVVYASGYSAEPSREVEGSIYLRKPFRASKLLQALSDVRVDLPDE